MIKQIRLGPLACELDGARNRWRVRNQDTGQQTCRDVGLCFQFSCACSHFTLSSVVSASLLREGPGRKRNHGLLNSSSPEQGRLSSSRCFLALNESEQIGIDLICIRSWHAVRETLIGFQYRALHQLSAQRGGVGIGDDLVIVAMHDQSWHRELLQVLCEISPRESDDAIIVRLSSAHHALAPPILNHTLRCFRARPVVSVKRPARKIQIELRPVVSHLRLESVEYFFRQAAGIRRVLHHQRRHCANEDSLSNATLSVTRNVTRDLAAASGVSNMDRIL